MKAENLTKEIFDEIFREIIQEKKNHKVIIIATKDIAKKLWQKHRIPIWKQAEIIRQKMREWWNSYKWISQPRMHKKICGVAVYLSSPMCYDYCCLEKDKRSCKSLITLYQNQREFFVSLEEMLFLLLKKFTTEGKHIDEVGIYYKLGVVIVFPSIKTIDKHAKFSEIKKILVLSDMMIPYAFNFNRTNLTVEYYHWNGRIFHLEPEYVRVYSEDLDVKLHINELIEMKSRGELG